jgi:hypothetical protein
MSKLEGLRMKTETTLTRAEHIIENALTSIGKIYGLPADDYNTIYRLLNDALSHIETRLGGATQLAYYSYELQPTPEPSNI